MLRSRPPAAQFAISPGLTESLLKAATAGAIPLIPGISTVSELMLGMDYGLREFKFFPAEANGGVKALQAIAVSFSQVRFCPTGGISPANYPDYPALKSVLCIGGSWLVPWSKATVPALRSWQKTRLPARFYPSMTVSAFAPMTWPCLRRGDSSILNPHLSHGECAILYTINLKMQVSIPENYH